MSADPNKKSARTFQCRDVLWETFEQMARELECSIDYLVNEAMKQYARQRSYGGARTPLPGQRPDQQGPHSPGSGQHSAVAQPAPPPPPQMSATPPPMPQPQRPSALPPPPPKARPSFPPPPPAGGGGRPPLPLPPGGGGGLPPPPPGYGQQASSQARLPAPPAARPAPPPMPLPLPPSGGMGGGMPPLPPPPMGGGMGIQGRASAPPPLPTPRPLSGAMPVPQMAPPMPQQATARTLVAVYGAERVAVTKDRFIIGRGKQTSDLTIKDPNVSRQHAMVEFLNGQYYMVDMGSTNGVEYMGQRIARKVIAEGDIYRICDHEVRFTYQ